MFTKRNFGAGAYIRISGILVLVLALILVVCVWHVFAQDDTPPNPSGQTQQTQQTQLTQQTQIVASQTPVPQTPVLTIAPLSPQKIGRAIFTTATLLNADGIPQTNKPLLVFVDGQEVRRDRTDDKGLSSISLGSDYTLGDHQLTVQFIGTAAYQSVSATTVFSVVPVRLTIQAVPPLAGIPISVDGAVVTTRSNGQAVIDLGTTGDINLAVLQKPDGNVDENTRATFVRWSDDIFHPARTLNITGDEDIQVGFSVSHPISHSFVDLSGNPVDYSKVSSLQVRTSAGDLVTFTGDQARWLTATQIARRRLGLEPTNILYSVETVTIDGTNVVNRYQQRFLAEVNKPWQIQLLLYSASISARDALLGFPVGRGISLQYPDGHIQPYVFGANNSLQLDTLARGTYQIKVDGVQSVTGWTPLALSRDQNVQLQVFSYLDVAVIAVIGILIALTMLFYGRPFLMILPLIVYRKLHKRSAPVEGDLAGAGKAFNMTFFHSASMNKALSSASTTNDALSERRRSANILQISGKDHALGKPIVANMPLGRLICVINGRSKRWRLLVDLVYEWQVEVARLSTGAAATPNASTPDGRGASNTGIFAEICEVYASLPESRRRGYKAQRFDFKSNGGQCENCEGKGRLPRSTEAEGYITCPVCRGQGYKSSVLKVKLAGKNIADVLKMTVSEALVFFADYPNVTDKLQSLQSDGLGDVILGEPGMVLNTEGVLNIHNFQHLINNNLYLFNAPLGTMTAGNAARQVTTLAQLLRRGSTLRVIDDSGVPYVIENPVVMVKLAANSDRKNAGDNVPVDGETPILGADIVY